MSTTRHRIEQTVFAAAVLIVAGVVLAVAPTRSEAGVRVRVVAPRAQVHVVAPRPVVRVTVPAPRPVVVKPVATIERTVLDRDDHATARRIAAHTSASFGEIRRLRARGWGWARIGRHLELNPRVVAACVR